MQHWVGTPSFRQWDTARSAHQVQPLASLCLGVVSRLVTEFDVVPAWLVSAVPQSARERNFPGVLACWCPLHTMSLSHMDAALACPLALFGHTTRDVLSQPDLLMMQRDLDVAELWSGVGAIVEGARHLKAVPFDISRCPGVTDVDGPGTEDITSEVGFKKALTYVLRLRPSGLLFMAVVCSSFGFCNVSNTKRNRNNVRGDESYPAVQKGNFMADIAAFFLCIALARNVHVVIENPSGSMLFRFLAPITSLFGGLEFVTADRCAYEIRSAGQITFKKPYKFLVSGPWLQNQLRKCCCPGGQHEALMQVNDKGHITGQMSKLRASAAYPPSLGKAIVEAWSRAAPPSNVQESSVQSRRPKRARLARSSSSATLPDNPWGAEPDDVQSQGSEHDRHANLDAQVDAHAGGDPWGASSPSEDDPWPE